jgi:hypothetical protein
MRTQYEYVARIAPIAKPLDVPDTSGEWYAIGETFERDCFVGQDPTRIPVILRHDGARVVGRLNALTRAKGWHIASFRLDPSRSLSVVAEELLRVGAGVSIGFRRGRLVERNGGRHYTQVTLDELSVLGPDDRPVYDGAQIIATIPIVSARQAPATASPRLTGSRRRRRRDRRPMITSRAVAAFQPTLPRRSGNRSGRGRTRPVRRNLGERRFGPCGLRGRRPVPSGDRRRRTPAASAGAHRSFRSRRLTAVPPCPACSRSRRFLSSTPMRDPRRHPLPLRIPRGNG